MKKLIAALGFMLLASPAFAITELSTAPVNVSIGKSASCDFLNLSAKAITVDVIMFKGDGTALTQTQFNAVPPGQSMDLTFTLGSSELVRCAFLFSGSSRSLRADIGVYDFTTGETMTALPAS